VTAAKSTAPKPVAPSAPAKSLAARIRGDIEARILSGDWAPGHRIPFEHELMVEYGCARMTVSKVLGALAESGLIERRRRAGSFVKRPLNQSAVLEIPDIKADVQARGQVYALELLSAKRRPMSKAERGAESIAVATEVLALTCRHFADGKPHALEERLINLDAVPAAAHADFTTNPPGTWLLQHVPWHAAENLISAECADGGRARLLGIKTGSACLIVQRRTWQSGKLLTVVRLIYPGPAQTLVARFTPAQRAAPSPEPHAGQRPMR